eukprot:6526649-Prymnesium_polylepis.1
MASTASASACSATGGCRDDATVVTSATTSRSAARIAPFAVSSPQSSRCVPGRGGLRGGRRTFQ